MLKSVATTFEMAYYCIIKSLLYCCALCLTAVTVTGNDSDLQIKAFKELKTDLKCWDKKRILSRRVTFKGGKTSMNDFFEVSAAELLDEWPVKKHNVNDVFHLLTALLSCEYCDSVYKIFEYIRRLSESCEELNTAVENSRHRNVAPDVLRHAVRAYQKCATQIVSRLESYSPTVQQMILTLEGLIKNTKNVESTKQDAFKILLSLYLHTNNFECDAIDKSLDAADGEKIVQMHAIVANHMRTVDFVQKQIAAALKEYSMRNCRGAREFAEYAEKISAVPETKILAGIDGEMTDVKHYVAMSHTRKGFVVERHKDKHEQLLGILRLNAVDSKVQWNGSTLPLDAIYKNYVNDCTDVRTVLKYDHLVVATVTRLVCGKVYRLLLPMMGNKGKYDAKTCDSASSVFDNFLSTLLTASSRYPIAFVNSMAELKFRLTSVTLYLKSSDTRHLAQKHFHRLESACRVNAELTDRWKLRRRFMRKNANLETYDEEVKTLTVTTLQEFLAEFALPQAKDTYMNPAVTNVLYRTSYLTMSGPFEYVFDYKTLHAAWTTDAAAAAASSSYIDDVCTSAVPALLATSESVGESIRQCRDHVEAFATTGSSSAADRVERCFASFSSGVVQLLNKVADVFGKVYANDFVAHQTRKLVLTIVNNVTFGRLYDGKLQLVIGAERVDDLIVFHRVIAERMKIFRLFKCQRFAGPMAGRGPATSVAAVLDVKNKDLPDCVGRNYRGTNTVPRRITADASATSGGGGGDVVAQMTAAENLTQFLRVFVRVFRGHRILFHRGGRKTNVMDAQSELLDGTFELQDLVEQQYLAVKWVFGWVFSTFVNILNAMIHHDVKHATFDQVSFTDQLKYLCSLDLRRITGRPIKLIVASFVDVVQYGAGRLQLENLKRFVMDELRIFGVALTTLPRPHGDNVLEYLMKVSITLSGLREEKRNKFSDLIDSVGLKLLLTGMASSSLREYETNAILPADDI